MTVRKAIVIPLASAHTELILATRFYESRVQNVKHAIVLSIEIETEQIDDSPVTLHKIWMDQIYVYAATSIGLDVIDIETSNKVSYIDNIEGFTSVWSSEDVVYLGTNDDGLKYIEKETISGSESAPYNLENNLKDYNYYYNTSSNQIKYLHGYNDTLAVVTGSGIDILNNTVNSFKSTTSNINVTKCFLTPANEIYYIVQGTAEDDGIFKMNTVLCDWSNADTSYKPGQSFIPEIADINDLFITTKTSKNNIDNTLFVATTSGAYVFDEEEKSFDRYTTLLGEKYTALNTIYADLDSSRDNGKLYTTSSGNGAAFSIVDLDSKILYDSYTLTVKGRSGVTLEQEDIKDINIGE